MLATLPFYIPETPEPGAFGAVRRHDIHTGVDLYLPEGTPVFFVETGTVVGIEHFTGGKESPWWNDTWAVLVESEDKVLLYGEVYKPTEYKVGQVVTAGSLCAHVAKVLKKMKGRPMTMLHFEMYKPGTRESVWWKLNEPKPDNLLNPTDFLHTLKQKAG